MAEHPFSLRFDFQPAKSRELIKGELIFLEGGEIKVETLDDLTGLWDVTSGLAGYQEPMSYLIKGRGCIPPTEALTGQRQWSVSTLGQQNWKKGIEGLIFPIWPETVTLETETNITVIRDHFGVHRDANVPGSSGCIVLTDEEQWLDFCEVMRDLHKKGVLELPLEVRYYPQT
jgi:hypothetical protein